VQAVGTAFSVQAKADAVDVVVTEGRVAVERTTPLSGRPAWPATAPVLVGAGDRLLVPAAIVPGERLQVQALPPAEIARRLAWRGPRIELAGTPLRAAVELFNRESHVQLRIADASLADLRLSGVFRADNAEGFARLLEANYEVRTQRRGDEIELRSK
jgi:transmembrane sensor